MKLKHAFSASTMAVGLIAAFAISSHRTIVASEPAESWRAVSKAMEQCVAKHEIAGAVTLVATRAGNVVHESAVGEADIASGRPMETDSLFWIASMTKPITATAIHMLEEEGKLSVDDPVSKYIPELAGLHTADGKKQIITLRHCLTHTSGMAEPTSAESMSSHSLAEVVPHFVDKPLFFEPGSKWQYCQSGINTLGRIIEVASGQTLPEFFQKRLFDPLKMTDTTFYPTPEQIKRLATSYKLENGKLEPAEIFADYNWTSKHRFPAANGGLFSTASDYSRFLRMILNDGTFDEKQYLKPETIKRMTSIQTGDLKTGFTPGDGWGFGWCVVREPQGVTAMLSPGSCGHGGAYGTQAWIDPVKGVAYVLMVQRANFPNSDASDVRLAFQTAAADELAKKK